MCCHKHLTHEVQSGPRAERQIGTACTLALQQQLLPSSCRDHPLSARHFNSAYQDISSGAAQSYSATTSPLCETRHIFLKLHATDRAAPAKPQSKRQENTFVLVPVELPVSLCAQWSFDFLLNSQRNCLLLKSSAVWHAYTLIIFPKYLHCW